MADHLSTKDDFTMRGGNHHGLRRWLLLNLILLALLALLNLTYPFQELGRHLGDFYFRIRGPLATSSDVVLVLIDDQALSQVGRWPWPRARLAQLITAAGSANPRVLGVDIILSEPESEASDRLLAAAIRSAGNVVLAAKISNSPKERLWVDPLSAFQEAAIYVGHVQATLDPDGICRRVPAVEPSADGPRAAFGLAVARMADRGTLDRRFKVPPPGANESGVDKISLSYLTINYRGQLAPNQRVPPFVSISAADLMEGRRAKELEGKVVMVGFGATEVSDRLVTPVSGQAPMPGIEINANLVDTLLTGREIRSPGTLPQLIMVILASMLSLWIVLRWPNRGLFLLLLMLVGSYLAGYFIFLRYNLMIEFGPLLGAMLLAAPLAQLENLIVVDFSVTRGLQEIKRALASSNRSPLATSELPGSASSNVHWKLHVLRELQQEMAALYSFDQTLLENIQAGLAVFGADGKLLFRNLNWIAFCESQHYNPSSDFEAFTSMMEDWADLPQRLKEGWLEKEIQLKEKLYHFRAVCIPSTTHAASGALMLIVHDITAQMERDYARSQALSFVTHELRTPLVAIQGFAEYLMRYPKAESKNEASTTIFREARRLVAMIDTYLEVLRLDVGSRPLRQQAIDINEMVSHVNQILQPIADAAAITIHTEIEPQLPPFQGDEPLLSGAMLNLVSNAIKYSPHRSEVKVGVFLEEQQIVFEVINVLPVIPIEDLERLFDPFYRGRESRDSTIGWGLGLAFVKRIAEEHGGHVEASSDAIIGTRFRMVIPVAPSMQFRPDR